MPQYNPPLRDMQFVMHELNVVDELKALPNRRHDAETINAVLEEGGKFAAEVIFPLNHSGDKEGCTLDKATHEVKAPKGFKEAYAQYVEGGWPALSCDPEFGGQGLPIALNQCIFEMLNSANQAWTMYPGLSHGAYEALHAHGTAEQKKLFLPKLVSGEWTGTMCLTEPHCGTDLGLLRTKAEPQGRPAPKITSQKIFISARRARRRASSTWRTPARCAKRRASRCSWCRFMVNADGRWVRAMPSAPAWKKMGIHGTPPRRSSTAPSAAGGRAGRAWPRCS
jgi:alkylation response protein AidB-like acyl-CoA dehydrogenase